MSTTTVKVKINLKELLEERSDKLELLQELFKDIDEEVTISYEADEEDMDIDIEDFIESFGTDSILSNISLSEIEAYVENNERTLIDIHPTSVFDLMKLHFFIDNFYKFELTDLEKIINKK